jgi:hypothetical protein
MSSSSLNLLPNYKSQDANIQTSCFSPNAQSNRQSPVSSSLHMVIDDLQKQMRVLSDRLDQVSPIPSCTPLVRSVPVLIDSRPSSTQSIRYEQPSDKLSEEFLRAEVQYLRLKSALELRSRTTNNNRQVHNSTNPPLQSSGEPCQSIPSSSLPFHSTTTTNNLLTSPTHPSSSAFEPINKASSPMSTTTTPPVVVQPLVSRHSMLTPNVTMTINNNLPTFKGLAHERPIQFINDFEIRASALVGNNDSSLLQTIQQSLSDGALIWFGQLQKSSDRITTWSDFKTRFYERYHTPTKVQTLRTELRLLFQGDSESTLDYFDRLKALMNEIDPDGSDNWLKHKFIQKLRSDIRTRLDIDVHLPVRDIVRKAQLIESNIEQQKVDEKLKLAVKQEKKNMTNLITNNLSLSSNHRQQSPVISPTQSSIDNNNNYHSPTRYRREFDNNLYHNNSSNNHHFMNRMNQQTVSYRNHNNNHHQNNNNRIDVHRNTSSNHQRRDVPNDYSQSNSTNHQQSNSYIHPYQSSSANSNNTYRSSTNRKTRWWCPHCQRPGHSWERCPHNPDGVNYRPNYSSNHPSSSTTTNLSQPSSRSPPFHHNISQSENRSGR